MTGRRSRIIATTAINRVSMLVAVTGMPVDDVRALIVAEPADKPAGAACWRVATIWQDRPRPRARPDALETGGEPMPRRCRIEADEPLELCAGRVMANPQDYLLAAINTCLSVGFKALCALHGVEIETLDIVTEGEIDLRFFFGLGTSAAAGYDRLRTTVTVQGSVAPEAFHRLFELMLATSPNFHNVTRPIRVMPELLVA